AFFRRHDVDLPAGQFRRESDVLTTSTDRLGKVFSVNHNIHGSLVFVHHNGLDMSRRNGANYEFCGVVSPQHDIDLFTTQLIAHGGDTRTAHAHAGTDGVNAFVVRHYGDFSADTRVAGSGFDL